MGIALEMILIVAEHDFECCWALCHRYRYIKTVTTISKKTRDKIRLPVTSCQFYQSIWYNLCKIILYVRGNQDKSECCDSFQLCYTLTSFNCIVSRGIYLEWIHSVCIATSMYSYFTYLLWAYEISMNLWNFYAFMKYHWNIPNKMGISMILFSGICGSLEARMTQLKANFLEKIQHFFSKKILAKEFRYSKLQFSGKIKWIPYWYRFMNWYCSIN